MAAPPITAGDIRTWSLLDLNGLGFGDDARLQVQVDRAATDVQVVTYRDPRALSDTDFPNLIPLYQQAVQVRTEMLVHQAQPDYQDTLADFDLLSSFSAGPYTESRRSPGEAVQAKVLSQNPVLHELLWNLMTPAARDDYQLWLLGIMPPALSILELDMSSLSDHVFPRLPNLYPYVEP